MPLVLPNIFKPIKEQDLRLLVGKTLIDDAIPLTEHDAQLQLDDDTLVFKSQLPENVVILRQDNDNTAITGAFKSKLVPILVDANHKITRVF